MLYGLENIDEQDLPEPQHDEPVLPLFSRRRLRHFPAVSISPTAWATPFSQQWVACKLSELDWFERIVTERSHAGVK
jgi:gamma-glutamylputrescine synthase